MLSATTPALVGAIIDTDSPRSTAARHPSTTALRTWRVDPVHDGRHRRIVGVEDLLEHGVVAQGEQHGYGLGRRACHVIAADGPVGVARAQRKPGDRVHAGHEIEEVVFLDRASQPEPVRSPAVPDAGRLAAVEVVAELVLDVVAPGVGASQGRGPGGHGRLPHGRVHSSVIR